nr:hypothetical protein [Nocardia anaemiae]
MWFDATESGACAVGDSAEIDVSPGRCGSGCGVAGDVAGDCTHAAGQYSAQRIRSDVGAHRSSQTLAGFCRDRPGHRAGNRACTGGSANRAQVEALAIAFSDLDTLGGQIRARPESRAKSRATGSFTNDLGSQSRCRLLTQLASCFQTKSLDKKRRPLGSQLVDQLLHRLTDYELDGGGGSEVGDLTDTGYEGYRQHCGQRKVDRQLGVLDIGGTVFELFREAVAGIDEALQIAAVPAGDILPVCGHRVVNFAVDGGQSGVHRLIGRLLQFPQGIGHIRPVFGCSAHGVFIALGPMTDQEVLKPSQRTRKLRKPQSHRCLPLQRPERVSVVLILVLQAIGGGGDAITGRLQLGRQVRQRSKAFPDAALAVPLRIVLLELLSRLVLTPAAALRLKPLPKLLQR